MEGGGWERIRELLGIRRSADILVGMFPCCPCAATTTGRQECRRSPPTTRECARGLGAFDTATRSERGHSCPMPLGFAPTKYARPGQVFVPEGHPIIAQRFNVGNQRPWSDKSRRDG